ncbi:MAG: glycyl-tRNA synthetase beta chain [Thermoanaerobaculia bacterium]|jgi:glycyl-tRNA synthetase beta chain|nr:glycyl-tRNA synthetase beta chain [Thermoanaerobaculia bacterium]
MAEYFFELLTEEIPAWMHEAAQATLLQQLTKLTQDLGEPAGDRNPVIVNSTPRRIIFFLSRIPLRESDREEEVKGPPVKAAYDAEGKPTQALNGFLKKNSAAIEDVIAGGDYIRIRRQIKGRSAGEILQQRVPQILESLRWPKMMRWGKGEHSYIRPIHSIVSVFDGEHLPITIFGVVSGTTTRGHRTLAPGPIETLSYNDYVTQLELNRVVIDAERRRHVMAERARILGQQAGGTPSIDASIWSQWQYLTEYPGVVRAEFGKEYLALPEEVLVTVMRVHQKQLPIRTANGKLTSSFLAVLDNDGDPDGNAAYGNSFVTNARFADAKFFYETDRKRTLEERLPELERLQFQEKLGNYLDKTRRIEEIAAAISDDAETLAAARLCKTDLGTEMVKEFTELQGNIGGIYAREEGMPDATWQAIYDHYLPINIDDALPRTLSGAVVSLADKIDNLVGFFIIGAKPTGSKDPFALRRAAQGVVQILLNRDKRCVKTGIDKLIDVALQAHKQPGNPVTQQLKTDLLAFFAERVRTLLEASAYGFAYDEIAAAMEAGWAASLTDLVDRITAVKAMRNEPNFLSILDSAKRIANITAGQQTSAGVDPSQLENDVERRLAGLASAVVTQIEEMISERDYKRALETFAAMAPELETFFDEVMVMVEDETLRRNRMSLLHMIGGAVAKIADVTKIVVDRSEYRA